MNTTTLCSETVTHQIRAIQHGKIISRWIVSSAVWELTDYAIDRADKHMTELARLGRAEIGYFDLVLVDGDGEELDAIILIA